MAMLRQDGMRWVLSGVTSLEEVVRVTREILSARPADRGAAG